MAGDVQPERSGASVEVVASVHTFCGVEDSVVRDGDTSACPEETSSEVSDSNDTDLLRAPISVAAVASITSPEAGPRPTHVGSLGFSVPEGASPNACVSTSVPFVGDAIALLRKSGNVVPGPPCPRYVVSRRVE